MKNLIVQNLEDLQANVSTNLPLGALDLVRRLGINNRTVGTRNYSYLKREGSYPESDCPCTNVVYDQLAFCPTNYITERCLSISETDFSTFDGLNLKNVFQKEVELLLEQHNADIANLLYSFIGTNIYTGNSNPLYIEGFLNNCDVDCSAINLATIAGANGIVRDGSLLGTGNILGAVYGNSAMAKMVRTRFRIFEDLTFSSQYNLNTVLLLDNQRLSYHTARSISNEDLGGLSYFNTHINITVSDTKCIGENWVVRFWIEWGLCAQTDQETGTTGVYNLIFDTEPTLCTVGIKDGESGEVVQSLSVELGEIELSEGTVTITDLVSVLPDCCTDSLTESNLIINYNSSHIDSVTVVFDNSPHNVGNNPITVQIEPISTGVGSVTIRLISENCDRWTVFLNYNII